MDKDKLMEKLQKLLYTESVKFVNKHKLSIQSIKMDSDFTVITENTTIMDSPSRTKTYKISNAKINKELGDG